MPGTARPYPEQTSHAAFFSADKHLELTSTPASVTSYSRDLATRLSALREVATLLVDEQRAYHREFINARCPDPKIYSVGDTVFARRATRLPHLPSFGLPV